MGPNVDATTRAVVGAAVDDAPEDLPPAAQLGRYVLGDKLGQGGMGSVYRAHDPQLGRNVAIKVLARRLSTSEQTRLREEARALAMLAHPNVVPIFDVGVEEQTLFIAMELVEGTTLGEWLAAGAPPATERLESLIAVGRGLAAAHAVGIVHRDVKPGNVLVGDDGRVRVADFGIALSNESAPDSLTTTRSSRSREAAGYVEGTPGYMAPEQHAGVLPEVAADQYSFCVMATEVLTGKRPFAGLKRRELVAAKLKQPSPQPPANMSRRVWSVVRRGMNPDPTLRWPSMTAMLDALEKSRRRGRAAPWIVAVGSLAAVGLLVPREHDVVDRPEGNLCTEAQPHPWTRAQHAAARSRFVDQGVEETTDAWHRVDRRLGAFAERWREEVGEACDATSSPRSDPSLLCLQRAGERATAFVELLSKASAAETRRAAISVWSATQLQDCTGEDAAPPVDDEAMKRVTQAQALLLLGRVAEAEDLLTEILATLDEARTYTRARARGVRGLLRVNEGRLDEARADLETAYHLAATAGFDEMAFSSAVYMTNLEAMHRGDELEAARWLRHAEAGARRGRFDRTSAALLNAKAEVRMAAGDYDRAVEFCRREVELRRSEDDLPRLAGSLQELAIGLSSSGRHAAAIEPLREALGIWEVVEGRGSFDEASTRGNLAAALAQAGRYEEAIAEHDRALEIFRERPDPPLREFGNTYVNRGVALSYVQRHDEAIESLTRGIELLESTVGRQSVETTRSRMNLGLALMNASRYEDARREYIAAHEWFRSEIGDDHPMTAIAKSNVAEALRHLEEYEEAARFGEEAAAVLDKTLGSRHPYVAATLGNLGEIEVQRGQRPRGLAHLDRALSIYEQHVDHHQAAAEVAERILEILGDAPGPNELGARARKVAAAREASPPSK